MAFDILGSANRSGRSECPSRTDKDGDEIDVHHYEAFDIKPDRVRCEKCKALLDRLDCVRITPHERTSGSWFCKDHFPLEVVREKH
jgi:hypothetical protein